MPRTPTASDLHLPTTTRNQRRIRRDRIRRDRCPGGVGRDGRGDRRAVAAGRRRGRRRRGLRHRRRTIRRAGHRTHDEPATQPTPTVTDRTAAIRSTTCRGGPPSRRAPGAGRSRGPPVCPARRAGRSRRLPQRCPRSPPNATPRSPDGAGAAVLGRRALGTDAARRGGNCDHRLGGRDRRRAGLHADTASAVRPPTLRQAPPLTLPPRDTGAAADAAAPALRRRAGTPTRRRASSCATGTAPSGPSTSRGPVSSTPTRRSPDRRRRPTGRDGVTVRCPYDARHVTRSRRHARRDRRRFDPLRSVVPSGVLRFLVRVPAQRPVGRRPPRRGSSTPTSSTSRTCTPTTTTSRGCVATSVATSRSCSPATRPGNSSGRSLGSGSPSSSRRSTVRSSRSRPA